MTECPTEEHRTAWPAAEKRGLGLSELVLIGLALGIAVGVFFGEMVGWIKIVGDVFITLLQVTVIPFISVSLITGLRGAEIRQSQTACPERRDRFAHPVGDYPARHHAVSAFFPYVALIVLLQHQPDRRGQGA